MEDAGSQNGVGAPFFQDIGQMLQIAGPAAGHHRNPDRLADASSNHQVEALLGAVGVDGIEDDLAGPQLAGSASPFDCV